jgi:TRAP-type transport system small permease protein
MADTRRASRSIGGGASWACMRSGGRAHTGDMHDHRTRRAFAPAGAMIDRAAATASRLIEYVIGSILAVMVVLVFGNVVLRYGFNSGIATSEELSRYLFIWLTFLGAVVALHEHAHLGVDSLVTRLPRQGRLACVIASDALMLAAAGMLFIGSWTQTVINLNTRSPVSQVPLAVIYVAGLVASALMILVLLRHLWKVLFVGASDADLVISVESEDLAGLERSTGLFLGGEHPEGREAPAVHATGGRT